MSIAAAVSIATASSSVTAPGISTTSASAVAISAGSIARVWCPGISTSGPADVLWIKVRVRFKLQVLTGLTLRNIRLEEIRNLLVGFQQSSSENTRKRLVTFRIERGCDTTMSNATSST